jgi:hypothetical protein
LAGTGGNRITAGSSTAARKRHVNLNRPIIIHSPISLRATSGAQTMNVRFVTLGLPQIGLSMNWF